MHTVNRASMQLSDVAHFVRCVHFCYANDFRGINRCLDDRRLAALPMTLWEGVDLDGKDDAYKDGAHQHKGFVPGVWWYVVRLIVTSPWLT